MAQRRSLSGRSLFCQRTQRIKSQFHFPNYHIFVKATCPGRFALQLAATTRKREFPFLKSKKTFTIIGQTMKRINKTNLKKNGENYLVKLLRKQVSSTHPEERRVLLQADLPLLRQGFQSFSEQLISANSHPLCVRYHTCSHTRKRNPCQCTAAIVCGTLCQFRTVAECGHRVDRTNIAIADVIRDDGHLAKLECWNTQVVSSFRLGNRICHCKKLWNCISLPERFLLRVVVSYFLVLGCRFAYLSLYLGFWTEVVT